MNQTVRNMILFVVALVVGWWVLRFIVHLALGLIFGVIVPIAVVAAICYGVYLVVGRKALGGGRRYLP